MTGHFNQLTPAEAERLAMLAEECGEVIQVIGKILRHGYDSYHPANPRVTNRDLLAKELRDVNAVLHAMSRFELSEYSIQDWIGIWERKLQYTHPQEELAPAAPTGGGA
jgi:NTP pyrophosphatase (non-canonical NTP hydrolase)